MGPDHSLELPSGWAHWEVEPIKPGGRRTPDELLFGRGKLVRRLASARILEEPPGSEMRRRALTSAMRGGFALTNRLDYDALMRGYREDCRLTYPEGRAVGLETEVTGHAGIVTFLAQFDDVFGRRTFLPTDIVDPGGPFGAGRADSSAAAHGTGIAIPMTLWYVWRFEQGKVAEQEIYGDTRAALDRLRELVSAY